MKLRNWILAITAISLFVTVGCRSKADAKAEAVSPTKEAVTVVDNKDFVPDPMSGDNKDHIDYVTIEDAFFTFDSSTLTTDARMALANSAAWLEQNRNNDVVVEGHCDERGTEQYNMALGEKRASAARDYLVTLGVDMSRITTVSYGEEKPFEKGSNEDAWAKNRRAHLISKTK